MADFSLSGGYTTPESSALKVGHSGSVGGGDKNSPLSISEGGGAMIGAGSVISIELHDLVV